MLVTKLPVCSGVVSVIGVPALSNDVPAVTLDALFMAGTVTLIMGVAAHCGGRYCPLLASRALALTALVTMGDMIDPATLSPSVVRAHGALCLQITLHLLIRRLAQRGHRAVSQRLLTFSWTLRNLYSDGAYGH